MTKKANTRIRRYKHHFERYLINSSSVSFSARALKHAFLECPGSILVNTQVTFYDGMKRKIIFDSKNDKKC